LALVGGSGVNAANPSGWKITFVKIPTIVGAGNGNDAGYQVTVENQGPSQINGLSMTVTPTDTPAVLWSYLSAFTTVNAATPVCTTTAPLTCQLGTYAAGSKLTFTIAYPVAAGLTGTFDVDVSIRASTGDVNPDGGHSRGDAFVQTASTTISSSPNFDGGFVVGSDDYATGGSLGRNNKQNTALIPPGSLIPVTIEDGITTGVTCDPNVNAACNGVFGEWSRLNVNNGTPGLAFKATLFVWGGAVPGGVGADEIQVVHVLDGGGINVISQHCTFGTGSVPTNVECITPSKVGSNYQIIVWLFQNGAVRGGI